MGDKRNSYKKNLRSGDTQPVTNINQCHRKQQLDLRARACPILAAWSSAARDGLCQQNMGPI